VKNIKKRKNIKKKKTKKTKSSGTRNFYVVEDISILETDVPI
jgi:hypothetical protein